MILDKLEELALHVSHLIPFRSSHRRCSVKKGVLKNFPKFTGNHLGQSLFFNKVAGLRPATSKPATSLKKRDSGTGVLL